MKETSILLVMEKIESISDFKFFYSKEELNLNTEVDVKVKKESIDNVLNKLFGNTSIDHKIIGKQIVLTGRNVSASPVKSHPVNDQDQGFEVSGTVTDTGGSPLPGASILEKGTTRGTQSDFDGNFTLTVTGEDAVLVVSYMGFITAEVGMDGQSRINVTLKEDVASLEEVVVVGYGTQKKVNLTGSVAEVSSRDLENRPVTSVTNAIQGTMPGVTVTAASSGQPGHDSGSIRVRGIGTLNNSNAMVLVDGVVSTMNNVNPDDIESITVLKDAASAAIYGSRAANGVILITTKSGKKGDVRVNLKSYVGKTEATYLPDFVSSWQAAELYNQALINQGQSARWTPEEIQKFRDGSDPYNYPNTDWLDHFYNGNGIQQNHYVDVSGGTEKTQYLFSLGGYDQNGLVKGTNAKRYTFRSNINTQLRDNLSAYAKIAFTNSINKEPSNPYTEDFTQIVRQVNRISRTVPYKYENGFYGYIGDGSPMAWLDSNSFFREEWYDLVGNIGADWKVIEGLHFKPMLAYVYKGSRNKKFIADIQYYNSDGAATLYQGPNSVTDGNSTQTVVTNQYLIEYNKSFDKHHLDVLLGYSQELTKYDENEGFRMNLLNNELSEIDLGSTDGQTASGFAHELALQSYFGRVAYNYDDKYLFEGNIRRDGSSRFSRDNRWGVFPSFSAGWNMDRENFFTPFQKYVNTLKIRGSWGELGNQNVTSQYPYITTISSGVDYNFGGGVASGVAPLNGANATIKWETTAMTTVGLDAAFLDRKLSLTIDYFDKRTRDILLDVPVGAVYGLSAPVQNAGAVKNTGWEFALAYKDQIGDFSYNVSANASFIKNEITDLNGTGPIISGYTVKEVGLPINSLYGYVAEGIFQSREEIDNHATQDVNTSPGDLKYKDLNNDGVINTNDRQYLGTTFPKTTYGINLVGNWKSLDFSIFFQGAAGVKSYTDLGKIGEVSDAGGKPTSILLDSWTETNTSAGMPRLLYSQQQNNPLGMPSSFWVRSGGYLRLKNLQIGYSLPEKWLSVAGIQKARLYYSGQNILTFSSLYDWVDPEAPNASSLYYYPQVKVNSIGVNITF